jgi:hypothetical protein
MSDNELTEFHRDRYLNRDAPTALRKLSGEWLIAQGHLGCRGVDLLPFGELPE